MHASPHASNERLHAEINGWFRQTQNLHPATLKLKLNILARSKLLAHNSALQSPTARQMLSSHVLARPIGCGLWAPEEWVAWAEDGRKKAELPMEKSSPKRAATLQTISSQTPCCGQKASSCKRPQNPIQPGRLSMVGKFSSEVHGLQMTTSQFQNVNPAQI